MTIQTINKDDKYIVLNYEGKKYFAFSETLPTYFEKDAGSLVNYETIESNITQYTANENASINISDDVTLWDDAGNPYNEIIALGSVDFVGTRPVRRPNNG